MNTQQLHDLRLAWKQNPNKVISKQAALEVLDDYIKFKASSERLEGTTTALHGIGQVQSSARAINA